MAQILSGSIDVSKIDKTKIKTVTKKDASTAKYLEISIFISDEQDNYGNIASISIGQTKEEREAKETKVYIGNLKRTWAKEPQGNTPETKTNAMGVNDSDLPF